MTANELRNKYLEFFKQRGHAIVPSSPLVPENDPTTLFTGSGMQPMVPYLLGQTHPEGTRIVDSQKCFRAQDIEEVGDNRHDTFFEMLGNWSLGDYFKAEQIPWMFEFLTNEKEGLGLDPKKLFITVFRGQEDIGVPRDTEAVNLWKNEFLKVGLEAKDVDFPEESGMQDGRIFYYEAKKNWWSRSGVPENMPIGEPGGPDSEVFYDFGANVQLHEQSKWKDAPCHLNCDCGRFMEIGNNVFMAYRKTDTGFVALEKKNIDFGGGLERMIAAVNNDPDQFKTDSFQPIIKRLETMTGRQYGENSEFNFAIRIIADHIRAAVMLAADGVVPSNKAQGYFARRLVRRAIRYADKIGISKEFIPELVEVVIGMYEEAYPTVLSQKPFILETLLTEESKFRKTLSKGLREIEKVPTLDGHIAFQMYETYGFPLELTQEIAQERGQVVDSVQFADEFKKHKDLSRTASSGMFKGGLADQGEVSLKYHTATHLLQAALRKVLGDHVGQKGSNITGERLRFDFSHSKALTPDEKQKVEDQINQWITADLPVTKEMMAKQEAVNSGAIAFFIEKYPDTVSVYTIGKDPKNDWVSKELCGGPHVEHTGVIGPVKIFKEEAVSAGVRRIYIKLA
ncbi:MAG: alanine--tRNA ligase [Candidatus Woesebacteria bacterium]